MLKIREAVIVEGRYDKIKLSSIVDAPIIETNGFRVFSDKEKQSLIRKIADLYDRPFRLKRRLGITPLRLP